MKKSFVFDFVFLDFFSEKGYTKGKRDVVHFTQIYIT